MVFLQRTEPQIVASVVAWPRCRGRQRPQGQTRHWRVEVLSRRAQPFTGSARCLCRGSRPALGRELGLWDSGEQNAGAAHPPMIRVGHPRAAEPWRLPCPVGLVGTQGWVWVLFHRVAVPLHWARCFLPSSHTFRTSSLFQGIRLKHKPPHFEGRALCKGHPDSSGCMKSGLAASPG